MTSRSPQPRRHRQRRSRPLLTAVLGVGALVGALEVSAHAVNSNDALRPSSAIGPAAVYSNAGSASATTAARTRAGGHAAIGSSVVVIIGKPSTATRGSTTTTTTRPTTATR